MSPSANNIIIDIPDANAVFNACFRDMIEGKYSDRLYLIHEGGRGSGKSDAVAQYLILDSLRKKQRIMLARKVFDTIRDSQFQLIKDYVQRWGLEKYFDFTTSPLSIKALSGSNFICKGFDKPEKVKSVANVDKVWLEEPTEMSEEDFENLEFSIRGKSKVDRQIILTYNRKLGNWLEQKYFYANGQFKDAENTYHTHTTFGNNKFLSQEDLRRFEQLRIDDPKKYEKIALGLPVKLEGLVYDNWDIIPVFPSDCRQIVYGLDFGYTDPKALVRIGRIGKELYLQEIAYGQKIVRDEFILLMKERMPERYGEIIADSEDPESIEVIRRSGFNIKGVEKLKGSVIFGVETMQQFNLHIVQGSTNTIKDFENYRWPEYKQGSVLKKEIEPMHAFSHAPRAAEYAVRTKFGKPSDGVKRGDSHRISIQPSVSIQVVNGY